MDEFFIDWLKSNWFSLFVCYALISLGLIYRVTVGG